MIVRFLVILAVVLLVTGLLWPYLTRLGLGRLPGDIVIERTRFNVYLPFTTSLLLSAGITFVLNLVLWFGSRGGP